MSKYRVTIFRHDNDHRWLAGQVFPKRPTQAQIDAAFPVLAEPGRYEVRLGLLSGEDEIHAGGWLQGEYVKDPANPTDAELAAAIDRGLADGSLVDAQEFLDNERKAQDMGTIRYALAHTRRDDGSDIAAYMPHNYSVVGVLEGERYNQALIKGTDDAGWTMEDYVIPRLQSGLVGVREVIGDEAAEAEKTVKINAAASDIATVITEDARGSGDDPIAWVTGNAYMPPLRSFSAAEAIWQDDETGEDFQYLAEQVEAKLADAEVALECPEYDNALYAVDLKRFEYVEDPGDHETLQEDWKPRPQHADYPHEPGRLHDCPACEDHCHCTPGYTECVFEGDHNGLADAPPGTPCEKCGCAS